MKEIGRIREEVNQNGVIVFAWMLAEMMNNKVMEDILTKTDREIVSKLMKKIEKKHSSK